MVRRVLVAWAAFLLPWAVACVLALVLSRTHPAAPVPPPPRELTPAMMTGQWEYQYGERHGTLWLHTNGEFIGTLSSDGPVYFGEWWIEEPATVVLRERVFYPALGSTSGPLEYRFQFAVRDYPALVGTCGGTKVGLTNRTR